MALDTPATVAVLGAGPIGLEAALYGRFLGYDVTVFERGSVCAGLLRWSAMRMPTPFWMNASPLGLAALEGQDRTYQPPQRDAILTATELVEQYFLPLSATDLLRGRIQTETGVGRVDGVDRNGPDEKHDHAFQIVPETPTTPQLGVFDAVINAAGADHLLEDQALAATAPFDAASSMELNEHGHWQILIDGAPNAIRPRIDRDVDANLPLDWDREAQCCSAMSDWLSSRSDATTEFADESSLVETDLAELSAVQTGVANYYRIGRNSFGASYAFRIFDGLRQVRLVFAELVGRDAPNLYKNFL